MKNSFIKKIVSVLTCLTLLSGGICATLSGCKPTQPKPPAPEYKLKALRTEGDKVVTPDGEEFYLRGTNIGGISAIEPWMCGFKKLDSPDADPVVQDSYTINKVFIDRFGMEDTEYLWAEYRENWWSEKDLQNCAEMGINVIRLPFTYMLLDFQALEETDTERVYDFTYLDEFISSAADYGMYTILDMHGAYGSQNGKDHSGQVFSPGEVDFYSNERKQQLTIDMWSAIAEHYKDNTNVAAYDILNEPAETTGKGTLSTEKRHWDVFDKIYDAIRAKDDNHIVIFESCWGANNLPQPSQYGWENCMYSFHHYTSTSDYYEHVKTIGPLLASINAKNFGVPLYMGEFCCYENEDSWRCTLEALNRAGWHWTSWTYKLNNTSGNSAWGIVRVDTTEESKVNAHADDYEVILEKFQNLKTTDDIKKFTFASRVTLWDLMREYCVQSSKTSFKNLEDDEYVLTDGANRALSSSASVGVRAALTLSEGGSEEFTLVRHKDGDGSYYLMCDGQYVTLKEQTQNYRVCVLMPYESAAARFFVCDGGEDKIILSSFVTGEYLAYDGERNLVRPYKRNTGEALVLTVCMKGQSVCG